MYQVKIVKIQMLFAMRFPPLESQVDEATCLKSYSRNAKLKNGGPYQLVNRNLLGNE